MTEESNVRYVPRYMGMTPFGEQLEVRLLHLTERSLLALVNERIDPSVHFYKWLGASTLYGYVQEIAKRWKGSEAKLWARVECYERDDAERPAPAPEEKGEPKEMTAKTATDPEPVLAQSGSQARSPRAPRPVSATGKKRTLKQAFKERFDAGDTDVEAFAAVKAEFDLPDSKKGYAAWYRKDLAKEKT